MINENEQDDLAETGGGLATTMTTTKTSAAADMAKLYRSEWDKYLKKIAPVEQELVDFASDPMAVTNGVNRAHDQVEQGFNQAREMRERDSSRVGLNFSMREKDNNARTSQIQETGAKVSAMNNTRLHIQDQQNRVMMGGAVTGLREQMGDDARGI